MGSDHGNRHKVVLNFTPAWFSIIMGTGIVSILLNTLPYNGRWLYWISVVVFGMNVLLFFTFLLLSILRYASFPGLFRAMLTHPAESLFLGTFPMGLATIINMFCFVCVPAWGVWAAYFAWAIWIFDAIVSVLTCFGVPFIQMTRKMPIQLNDMTAAWLLPIVSCVVAAASGAIVAEIIPDPQIALWTVLTSYVLWGIGVPFALMVIVIHLLRSMLYKLPNKAIIVSGFLPLGPLGQGGFGIQKLGQAAREIFPRTGTLRPGTGDTLYDLGFLSGLLLWAFGTLWLMFAVSAIVKTRRFPFNLGWWAFTFPLGVYTTCTAQLARDLPSKFFSVLATVLSLCVVLLWLTVAFFTAMGCWRGTLFVSPCSAEWQEKREDNARRGND